MPLNTNLSAPALARHFEGMTAALEVFLASGLEPAAAWTAFQESQRIASCETKERLLLTPALERAASIWRRASKAALQASGLGTFVIADFATAPPEA